MKKTTELRCFPNVLFRLNFTLKLTTFFVLITVFSVKANSDLKNEYYRAESLESIKDNPIKGTVKDSDGMPIPGVNVMIKGTNIGTTTDIDGNYILVTPDTAKTVVFSYLGMKTTEININGKKVLNAVLTSDAAALNEVVVVGYGTVRKSDITGAVGSVDTEAINKTQNTNIAQAVQGRTAGVTVSKSDGTPGATPTIRIRGTGTVNNADPLYVVDGVPISDITTINMADAKSVEILKDASATAIYGSRGANGVVLITTKSGKNGKATISYKTYTGIQNRIDNVQVLNAEQWATLYNEARANDGLSPDPALTNPASLQGYNWKDAVYRSAQMRNDQLSFSGGTDKTTYFISLGHVSQDGIINNTSYKRTNFRINNTYQIKPSIKVGHNIQYSYSNAQTLGLGSTNSTTKVPFEGYMMDPITPFYNPDGSYGVSNYVQAINPLGNAEYGNVPKTVESLFANFFVEADLSKGLTFKSNFGLEINTTKVDNFKPAYFVAPYYNSPVSTYNLSRSENRSMILSNTLNYNKIFAKKHSFNALLGQEIQEINTNNVNSSRNGIPTSVGNPTLGSGDISTSSTSGSIGKTKLVSFFGRLNYNYNDRYLITATYRMDGSSKFGSNNSWAQFPSAALAWNIHKESFFNIDAINQLKLRVGWGKTGSQNIPSGASYNTLNIGNNYLFGSGESTNLGVAPTQPGNPNLKWEATATSNIGLDLAFLNNSITFTADYFIRNTTNMLMAAPILANAGYSDYPYVNAGEIQNKGLELTANYKKVIHDFSFSVGGNISFIKNNVVSLASDGQIIQTGAVGNGFSNINRTEAGHPLSSFYGYEMLGLFQNQNEVNNYASLPNTKPGDVKYNDLNNDGVIDDKDKTYIGSPFPKFTYGINLDMNYKQFDFSAFFQGSQGNQIVNSTDYYMMGDYSSNSNVNILNRWTGEGTSNTIPRATLNNSINNNQFSSRFVQDGSYLRLKNIQIGYSLPDSTLSKTFIKTLRLYVAAQNLVTITKYKGLDPEVGVEPRNSSPLNIGIDTGVYPSVRTFSLGLDINF